MKPTKATAWDPAKYIETEEDAAIYLEEIFKMGDPSLIVAAIGEVARARGMSKIAEDADRGRESLCKSLAPDGNQSFETVFKLLDILGLQIKLEKKGA